MTLRDIELNTVSPIAAETSLRRAWQAMRDENTTTLLVADDAGALAGMVTLKDISSALLDGLDTHVLEKTRTSYANVVDALDGAVLSGEAAEKRVEGRGSPALCSTAISPWWMNRDAARVCCRTAICSATSSEHKTREGVALPRFSPA